MKKAYMVPRMEAIGINMNQHLLAGSGINSNSGVIPGGAGDGTGGSAGRAPGLFDDPAWDALLDE